MGTGKRADGTLGYLASVPIAHYSVSPETVLEISHPHTGERGVNVYEQQDSRKSISISES